MADGSVLFVFQNLYSPMQDGNKWLVNYRQNNKWEKETSNTREEAWAFYHKKERELRNYYYTFMRQLRVRK